MLLLSSVFGFLLLRCLVKNRDSDTAILYPHAREYLTVVLLAVLRWGLSFLWELRRCTATFSLCEKGSRHS